MLKYFNSGYFTRTLVLVFVAAVLWLPNFLLAAKTVIPEYPAPLYQLFLILTGTNSYIHLSIAFLLSIATAFLINQIATQFGITERISQIGMLIYILLSSALHTYTAMNPIILVNFLMLLLLQSLFKISEAKENIPLIFNSTFIIGITALVYFPAALFLILIWVGLLVFNQVNLRNIVVSVIGIALPFLFAFTWYFWFDQTSEAYSLLLSSFQFHLPNALSFSISDWGISLYLFLFLLMAVVKTNNNLMEKNISIRQILIVTLNYALISIIVVLFFSTNSADSLLLAIPASLIFAATLSEIKKTKWPERLLKLTLLLILINQYAQLFYAA